MIALNVKSIKYAVHTRVQRRSALNSIIKQLVMIREAEIKSLENRPLNLRNSFNYYIGVATVESIEFAIDYLVRSYKDVNTIADYMKNDAVHL